MALTTTIDLAERQKQIQDEIERKLDNGIPLTDSDIDNYQLRKQDEELFKAFADSLQNKPTPGFNFKDFVASPSARVLIPRIIIGEMRRAAEPVYLASKFYKKVALKNGNAVLLPNIGVMRAFDVAEGQEIPEQSLDWNLEKSSTIHVGKSGVRIQYTDELQTDLEFSLISLMLQEASRAMARHKEQKAYNEWLTHGWTVFDNSLRSTNPDAGTTGLDFSGNLNDTISIDDMLDMMIACYNNEYTPSDLIIHPLAWAMFAKNGLTGAFTAPYDRETKRETPSSTFKLGPESIQGRVPFGINVNLSAFAPLDKRAKTFDMFVVDKDNVGVEIVKEALKTEDFRDPSRDLNNVKVVERYGFGTYNEGRAVCSAKNISLARSYATPERVKVLR